MNYSKIKPLFATTLLVMMGLMVKAQEWSLGLSAGYDLPIVDHQLPLYDVEGGV